jgi:hypothetical protein
MPCETFSLMHDVDVDVVFLQCYASVAANAALNEKKKKKEKEEEEEES